MSNRISHLPEDEAAHLALTTRLIGKELDGAREEVRRKSGEFPRLYAEYHSSQNRSGESAELSGDELTGLRDADFGRLVDAAGFLTFL